MNHTEENIDLLYRYIDGGLTSEEALYVEQQLAKNEAWQDVYEGLVFAEQEGIDVDATLQRIEEKILRRKELKKQAPIIPIGIRRFATVAAAISGFLLLSYAALQVINSGLTPANETAKHQRIQTDFHPEDQVQVIPTKNVVEVKQHFDSKKVENFVREYEDDFVVTEQPQVALRVEEDASSSGDVDFAKEKSYLSKPGSYTTLLARYGYKEVRDPNLLNTVRGASPSEIPSNHFETYSRNALSQESLERFAEEEGKNYIARFPFNGVVKVGFVVDKTGKAKSFRVIESPNSEATKVVETLFTERANWQAPLDSDGRLTSQRVLGTVSFGNTVFVKVDFE